MLLTFVILIAGACLVGVCLALRNIAKARGWVLQWWHWLMVAIWAFTWVVAFAWLGSQLGEGGFSIQGAWIGFGFIIGFNIILAAVIWQLIVRQKPSEG